MKNFKLLLSMTIALWNISCTQNKAEDEEVSNDIEGIYIGTTTLLNTNGNLGESIYFLLVYNDGKLKASQLLPENGFDTFNSETDRQQNPDYWAHYDLKTNKAVFPNRTVSFKYTNKKIIFEDEEFTKLTKVDALTLTAVYTADKDPLAVIAFGYEPIITFFADGRFEDKKALYYVKSYDAMFQTPGNGTYTINNYTIHLNYNDGRGSASFAFINLDPANKTSVQIGDHIMQKK
jgi:hypothetical protein